MLDRTYPEYPVKMEPHLPGGSIHKLRIKDDGLEILTWQGMFGNKESKVIFFLPYYDILEIQYKPSSMNIGYCRIVYLTQLKKKLAFKFNVIDQASLHADRYPQNRLNAYTKSVAEALQRSKLENRAQSSLPSFSATPPGAKKKVLYGFLLLICGLVTAGTGVVMESGFLWFFGTFWICMTIGALGIDTIRVETGWNFIIKIFAYIAIFIITFIIFATMMTLYEVLDFI